MAEAYGWLFVDFVPILYEKRRVARQLQVETWLDLTMLLNALKLELGNGKETPQTNADGAKVDYII